MSLKLTYRLIPSGIRKKLPLISLSALFSALVDLLGIAALVSVLVLVLDDGIVANNKYFASIYSALGFQTTSSFIIALCLVVVVVIALKGVFSMWLAQIRNRFMLQLYANISTKMYDNYLSRGLLFVRQHHTTQLINNVNSVCNRFAVGVVSPLMIILTESTLLVLLVGFLLLYNPIIVALAVVVFLPMSIIYSKVIKKRMMENGKMENKLQVGQNKTMYEALRGYADIEIGNAQPYISNKFQRGLEELRKFSLKNAFMRLISSHLIEFSLVMGIVLVIISGLLMGKEMSSLKLLLGVFAVAAYRIVPSVNRIVSSWAEYKRNTFVVATLSEALSEQNKMEKSNSTERLPFNKEILLNNISFGYDENKDIIKNLSLTIQKGEKIGFQGHSGTGKSTLFNLIAALFEPTEGFISIDGVRIESSLQRREWQNNIAYVSQDLFIPDVSIAENIAFGVERSEIDQQRLRSAIETAQLAELVDSLPEGEGSVTGEAGCRLSGGQRQRIGIARALYKESSVLMFDESTSSLDEDTENEIVESIKQLSKTDSRLTILFISHNDKTLAFCDKIFNI